MIYGANIIKKDSEFVDQKLKKYNMDFKKPRQTSKSKFDNIAMDDYGNEVANII